jgi:hypothetical protein
MLVKASIICSVTSSSHADLNSLGRVNALDVLFLFFAFKVFNSYNVLYYASIFLFSTYALNKSLSKLRHL